MQIFWNIVLLVVGFVFLVYGANWFVDGAAGIAGKLKIPELVVGLTVVAFGTSAPELSVSLTSAFQQSSDLSVGNILGSNVMNILLILGLSALVRPLPVQRSSLTFDLPFLLVVSALFVLLGATGNALGRVDGVILVALLVFYIGFLVFEALKERKKALALGIIEQPPAEEEESKGKFSVWYKKMSGKGWFLVLLTLVGLALIVCGADFVVDSASFLAETLGVEERIIGLTVVAIGTSLPELVTSVAASAKGKTDIAVGNIIGSNVFNLLCVGGISSVIVPLSFSSAFVIDAVIAFGAAVLLAVCAYLPGHKVRRGGGAVFLACFVGYLAYLFVLG